MIGKLPDISEIDCSKGEEINAYGQLLISSLHENGRIVFGPRFTKRQTRILPRAKEWLRLVEQNIGRVSVTHRSEMTDRYNMLYRFVYRTEPDMNFLNRVRWSVVEALRKGTQNIDLAQAMWLISFALRTSPTFDPAGTAQRLYDSIMRNWVADFLLTGNFLDMPYAEAVQRATTLIREDLSRFVADQSSIKQAVASRISLLFGNLIQKDADTLKAMTLYLRISKGIHMEPGLTTTLTAKILDILSMMPRLSRFERMAYASEREIMTSNSSFVSST